jgi:hypothetical protein
METPADPVYHDRKAGLVVFGVLEIAFGLVCVLLLLFMLMSQALAGRNPNAPHGPHVMFAAMSIYGTAAVAFIWLGIGSIMARRWARAILLCFSAVGLVVGIFACASMVYVIPHMFDVIAQQGRTPLQPAAMLMAKIFAGVFIFFVYFVIPGAMFLFYRSPHVKRTCEVRDPVERWTDRCPVPALALSLFMGACGVMFLGVLIRHHVIPLFGSYVSGGAGILLCILMGGLMLYLAYGIYRLQIQAWWITVALQVFYSASNLVTTLVGNHEEMFQKMGIDQRSAAMSSALMSSPGFKWMTILSFIPWLVWLLCIRRYFDKPQLPPVLSADQPPSLA